jgi:DNA polymerase alpha subunit A
LNNFEHPIPYNPDGSISFYWFDAHEENFGSEIYLFGKVYQPETKSFVSCTLKINGMQRILYALPKLKNKSRDTLSEEEEKKLVFNIQIEIEDLRKRKFA